MRQLGILAVAGALTTASAALAQDVEDYVQATKANYNELGTAFKAINEELRKPAPNLSVIRSSTRVTASPAKYQYGWLRRGSGPEAEVKTKALPAIWAAPATFNAAQDAFARQTAVFVTAAGSPTPPGQAAVRALVRGAPPVTPIFGRATDWMNGRYGTALPVGRFMQEG